MISGRERIAITSIMSQSEYMNVALMMTMSRVHQDDCKPELGRGAVI